jgi:hypothetical protein
MAAFDRKIAFNCKIPAEMDLHRLHLFNLHQIFLHWLPFSRLRKTRYLSRKSARMHPLWIATSAYVHKACRENGNLEIQGPLLPIGNNGMSVLDAESRKAVAWHRQAMHDGDVSVWQVSRDIHCHNLGKRLQPTAESPSFPQKKNAFTAGASSVELSFD